MRDSQKGKVYAAEDASFMATSKVVSLEDLQKLVDAVCASALIRERYPNAARVPTVVRAHGRRQGACYRGGKIELSESFSRRWITLHELAHHLVRPNSSKGIAAHGREYAECYLYLIRCFIGKGAAESLEAQFKAKRVAYKPKRAYTISDAERARRAERARALKV